MRQVYAALFGFETAVCSFGRWSAFLEAARRRLCTVLWTMYVDDGALIEFTRAAPRSQELINAFFTALGALLFADERTQMAPQDDVLGVVHDLTSIPQHQVVECNPRQALLDKANAILNGFMKENRCTLAEASKFRGVQGFLNCFPNPGHAP